MKIGIIGGGAAGMMAAITASKNKHNVTIIEHNQRIGKKILMTGNGRCNFTNKDVAFKNYYCSNKEVLRNVFNQFNNKDAIEFFNNIGVYPKEIKGLIYPYSEQASSLLDCLRREIIRNEIDVVCECHPDKIKISSENLRDFKDDEKRQFKVITNKGIYFFDKIIIATGSKAYSKTGSDGSGYEFAKSFGHKIIKPLPSLCALKCKDENLKALAGVRCDVKLSLYVDDELRKADEGQLQFTDYGISGIVTFQLSHIAVKAVDKKKNVYVIVDLLRELKDSKEVYDLILSRIKLDRERPSEEILTGLFNKNLCQVLLRKANIEKNKKARDIESSKLKNLSKLIKEYKIPVTGFNSYENAQVCTGGVDLNEVTYNLESKLCKGLYFAGEILDVDGECGGYNLQWAWSSGYVAGCLE